MKKCQLVVTNFSLLHTFPQFLWITLVITSANSDQTPKKTDFSAIDQFLYNFSNL